MDFYLRESQSHLVQLLTQDMKQPVRTPSQGHSVYSNTSSKRAAPSRLIKVLVVGVYTKPKIVLHVSTFHCADKSLPKSCLFSMIAPWVFENNLTRLFFGCFTEFELLNQCPKENKVLQECSDHKITHSTDLGNGLSHHANELHWPSNKLLPCCFF